ncbi:hypothetical protein KIPB_003256, partial [Kipferlia bialata]|eukprot:g3256.t1
MSEHSNVQVFVRIRPLVGEEVEREDAEVAFGVQGEGAQTKTVSVE